MKYSLTSSNIWLKDLKCKNKLQKDLKCKNKLQISESLSTKFGENLRQQVEDRLKFYESGDIPRKNLEVMADAQREHDAFTASEKKTKKRKRDDNLVCHGENGHDGENWGLLLFFLSTRV
ncbi:hypothetical protein HAZT_HAZT010699 [Hyalella azteca]|uniref:Uncharacterized protein n=1 Tax=Hyalella azteca TaxID=294128 RepID=A0A6A0HCF6_HYAAZ|nr:hypothetical protein HAZT_HAZT010699 [Hyalella azteca]